MVCGFGERSGREGRLVVDARDAAYDVARALSGDA